MQSGYKKEMSGLPVPGDKGHHQIKIMAD